MAQGVAQNIYHHLGEPVRVHLQADGLRRAGDLQTYTPGFGLHLKIVHYFLKLPGQIRGGEVQRQLPSLGQGELPEIVQQAVEPDHLIMYRQHRFHRGRQHSLLN